MVKCGRRGVAAGWPRGETMPTGLLGLKLGMTQVFSESGAVVPVTVLRVGPCVVLQVKSAEREGYAAVQLGFVDKPRRRATQPERGHARKANTEPKRYVREFPLLDGESLQPGQEVTVAALDGVPYVDVTGVTKGRGFAGVMKRHGFSGLGASHGTERKHRSGGSISAHATNRGYAGDIKKGKRMPGHMGAARRTARNLQVVRIDQENHLLVVRGSVPGPNGGVVMVRRGRYQARG